MAIFFEKTYSTIINIGYFLNRKNENGTVCLPMRIHGMSKRGREIFRSWQKIIGKSKNHRKIYVLSYSLNMFPSQNSKALPKNSKILYGNLGREGGKKQKYKPSHEGSKVNIYTNQTL